MTKPRDTLPLDVELLRPLAAPVGVGVESARKRRRMYEGEAHSEREPMESR